MKATIRKALGVVLAALFVASPPAPAATAEGERAALRFPQEGHFSRALHVGESGVLDLSNVSGNITIRGAPGGEIQIEAQKIGNPSSVDIEVSQTGDRVRVETEYREGTNQRVSVDFSITVPYGTAVSAKSVSGDVEVHDVRGETHAESVSGDVTLTQVERLLVAKSVSGDVSVASATSQAEPEIASVSGDVVVSELGAPKLTVSSVSGDVRLTGTRCERASVESVSGTIHYSGTFAAGGRYEFRSHSGDVLIQLANDIGFELAAETFSGEIESAFPVTPSGGRVSKGEVHGVHGDGSVMIEASTFSGDVTVAKE